METITIALAGNPNAGKSSLFNALTGFRQHVGNWPGKTVEMKTGQLTYKDYDIELVDLPGTYSLNAFSPEEVIARDYLLNEKPDLVISVVDAANLERNLYLTVQILELGLPSVIALNMVDKAKANGVTIDTRGLSEALCAPVVGTVASRKEGVTTLLATAVATLNEEELTHA